MAHPLWKTVWRFLVTSDIPLSYHPAVLFPAVYPRDIKTCPRKELDINVAALFPTVKNQKQHMPVCSPMGGSSHTVGYHLAIKDADLTAARHGRAPSTSC